MGHSEGMIIFTQMHSSEERLEKKDIYIYSPPAGCYIPKPYWS